MNWDAIGAMAELAGAAGVIASLAYLASQIRLNARHLEASMYLDTNNVFVSWYSSMVADPQVAELWFGQILRDRVQPEKEHQARALLCMFFLAMENNWRQQRRGVLQRDALMLRGLPQLFNTTFVGHWLDHDGPANLTAEFLVDVQRLRKSTAA